MEEVHMSFRHFRFASILIVFILFIALGYVSLPKAGDILAQDSIKAKTVGGIEFVYIPGGEFMMGQSNSSIGCPDCSKYEQPEHMVKVSGFWMGKYEVTQKLYQEIMGINHSDVIGENLPAGNVIWDDAKCFCSAFNTKHKVNVRLPYEAEWEYACRAGTKTKYYWGNSIDGKYCWYGDNSDLKIHPVGRKLPNAWGRVGVVRGLVCALRCGTPGKPQRTGFRELACASRRIVRQ
jgi:formylglycine-generating enzyme required for sulfatase activity